MGGWDNMGIGMGRVVYVPDVAFDYRAFAQYA